MSQARSRIRQNAGTLSMLLKFGQTRILANAATFTYQDVMMRRITPRTGLTFAELMMVLAIVVALAAISLPLLNGRLTDAKTTATLATLQQLRTVIVSTYQPDMLGRLPRPGTAGLTAGRQNNPQLRYLFVNPDQSPESLTPTFNPVTKIGWRGPYMLQQGATYTVNATTNFTNLFGENGDPSIMDAWHNPIVILESVVLNLDKSVTTMDVLYSAGPDGILNTTDDIALPLWSSTH